MKNLKVHAVGLCLAAGLMVTPAPAAPYAENGSCAALSEDLDSRTCPDRLFALFLPVPTENKSLLFTVDHRASAPAFDNPFTDGLGLDNGSLKIGLGLRFAPTAALDLGFRRASNAMDPFDTYEFDLRYCALRQDRHYVDGCAVGGVSWFSQTGVRDASGFYGGLQLGRGLSERLYVSLGLLGHSNSTSPSKTTLDKDYSLAFPLGANFRVIKGFSLCGESFIPVAGYSAGHPSMAGGLKYATWRHSFSLFLSTTPYFTADGAVSGSDRTDAPSIAFLITRKFLGEK